MVGLYCRFSTKESATHAIVAVHNTDINGQTVKCSWGKESGDPNNAQQTGQVNVRSFIDLSWREEAMKFATEFWIKFETALKIKFQIKSRITPFIGHAKNGKRCRPAEKGKMKGCYIRFNCSSTACKGIIKIEKLEPFASVVSIS